MAISKQWFSSVRRKFHRSSHTILPATKTSTRSSSEETASFEEDIAASPTPSSFLKKDSTKGDTAATKIQAFFRGHLGRLAFRGPKSVVTTSRKKRLGKSQSCFRIVRRKSRKPSRTTTNRSGSSIEEANVRKETTISEDPTVAASSFLTTISEDPTVAASSFLTTISEDPTVAASSFLTTISEDPTVAASSFLTTISEDPTVAASSFLTTISEDPTVAASSTLSSQKTEMTREDMAAVKIQAFFRGHLARKTFRAGDKSISTNSKKKRTGMSRNCFKIVFRRTSRRDILSPDGHIPSNSTEEAIAKEESNEQTASSARNEEVTKETISFLNANGEASSSTLSSEKKDLTIEDTAAIKIQVRQTFRARETIATSSKKKRKGMPPNCFSIVQRRFRRRSPKATRSSSTEEAIVKEETIKVEDGNGAASSTPSSQKEELTKEDVAAVKIQAIFRGHRARRAFGSLKNLVSSSRKKENRQRTVRVSRNLFAIVRRKFRKAPHRDIIFPHNNPCARISTDEATVTEETINFEDANDTTPSTLSSPTKEYLTKEGIAAIKIQAFFRGHLARRAYRALKSLVKLQAVARGVCVRRQARIALHCMHALARLQVRVRARQLLNGDELL
ncbi:uncharacterized protein LOC133851887 isoform X2 [Alnus glutinosa]|uniref:uncharacterized protein LOC133851887 isoform X2 n=1 Tax=Alnus glutinosa TaxID=3517 RepID=UPI002D7676BC|nr:uncharacterized protein LOC133851887 isoform X2 [Alnus glutinosa]